MIFGQYVPLKKVSSILLSVAQLVFSEKDNGASVEVPPQARITIELQENPTTGYRWIPQKVDRAVLAAAGDEYVPGDQGGLGAGGTRKFFFHARTAGTITLYFLHKRPWQADETAVGKFQITVRISK
jgi:inhibitor of cysteine peptidase